ncbi:MAG: hypothetical protein GY906_12015 [bacterium]|nr:hypothetical protein [bacterium]
MRIGHPARRLSVSQLVVAVLLVTGAAHATDQGAYFVHATDAENTSSYATTVESILTNNKPNAILHVTSKPDVEGGGDLNDHVIGVWYSGGDATWKIFNQDIISMSTNTEFSIWIPPANASTFVHEAKVENTSGHVTTIDNPLTNNQPSAVLRVTQCFNPGGGSGVYNNHEIGVYYSSTNSKWKVFNQDIAALSEGASFNVTVLPDDPTVFVHTGAGGANTEIDHPLTNNNPNAIVQVTQNWNPPGSSGVYNDHVIGVFYGYSRWWIFNQDYLDMPAGASFNVSVPSPKSALFVHTADAANIYFNYSLIDNPLTNDNPNALILATQNLIFETEVYNDQSIGVFYYGGFSKWAVFNQDEYADMPLAASFNISVPAIDASTFIHTATAENIVFLSTRIDHPLTNNNPDAIVHVTQSWNPGNVDGVYHDEVIGVYYHPDSSKWAIFNEDVSTDMVAGPSFNVWIPPADASSFVHSATSGNIEDELTWFDHPVGNNNPDAIVLVTQNWMPNGIYHDHEIGVYYYPGRSKWTVFNQDGSPMPIGASFNVTIVDPPFFQDGFESGDTTAWSAAVP